MNWPTKLVLSTPFPPATTSRSVSISSRIMMICLQRVERVNNIWIKSEPVPHCPCRCLKTDFLSVRKITSQARRSRREACPCVSLSRTAFARAGLKAAYASPEWRIMLGRAATATTRTSTSSWDRRWCEAHLPAMRSRFISRMTDISRHH